ncbi:hypothetical protein HY251_12035 [bacterium]|nr:hypothetical protein [bacterium]
MITTTGAPLLRALATKPERCFETSDPLVRVGRLDDLEETRLHEEPLPERHLPVHEAERVIGIDDEAVALVFLVAALEHVVPDEEAEDHEVGLDGEAVALERSSLLLRAPSRAAEGEGADVLLASREVGLALLGKDL